MVKFGLILGTHRHDLAKMIKMLHNLPNNHEMITSLKIHPNSIFFGRVIAVTRILGKFEQICANFRHAQEARFGQNDKNAP